MKQCPLCLGEIPDQAVKCRHCGEWVDGRPTGAQSDLGQVANRYINYKIAMTIIGLILSLLFFLFIWLPGWNRAQKGFDNFPGPPAVVRQP